MMSTLRLVVVSLTIAAGSSLAADHEDATKWAQDTLARMSLRQKVGQMIVSDIRGEYLASDSDAFRRWSRLAREHGIGGFVVYGGSPHDTADLLNRLQGQAEIPLLVSADFEGGPGQQFAGATEFPANMALAAIGSEELAFAVGRVGALEGRAIGIHLTYSPVVDVQTRPENPVLSVRSFGRDVELLGRLASAYIRGYQENGMLATAKHYPGRGDVDLLPDSEYLINRKPAHRVEAEDLLAFKKAIDAGVTFVMSEHIEIPSITDGSDVPASASPTLATHWLRERLGFDGILTTDDLWYPKVIARYGAERAGVLAVRAGHDVLLKPADPVRMIDAVTSAVTDGEITEDRIDASVRRILYWKARLDLHRQRTVDVSRISSIVGTDEHRDLMHEIADRSLTVVRHRDVFPTSPAKLGNVVHITIQKRDQDAAPREVNAKLAEAVAVERAFFLRPDIDPAVYSEALDAAAAADTLILSLFRQRNVYRDNGAFSEAELSWLRQLLAASETTIVMSYGNPYLGEGLERASAFVVGYGEGGFYGNQLVYADAFVRLLRGEIEGAGKLPIETSAR